MQASVAGTVGLTGPTLLSDSQRKPLVQRSDVEFGSEHKAFEKLVGERFSVVSNETGRSTSLVLREVRVRNPVPGEKRPHFVRQQSCLLLFASEKGDELASVNHRFNHSQLGTFQLFISQTERSDRPNWKHYNAVIG